MLVKLKSSIFNELKICTTNLSAEDRTNVRLLVAQGGGSFSNTFDISITHLVIGVVGSAKHKASRLFETKEVTVEWVKQCTASGKLLDAAAFSVPPFLGLEISATGMKESGDRDRVRLLIQKNGGKWSNSLNLDSASHLIAEKAFGTKYEAAREHNGIKIVTPEWIFHCVRTNQWEQESNYLLRDPNENVDKQNGNIKASRMTEYELFESQAAKRLKTEAEVLAVRCHHLENREADLLAPAALGSIPPTLFSHMTTFLCGFQSNNAWKNAEELIGTGGATIFWQWNMLVTHVVVGPALTPGDERYLKHIRSQQPAMKFFTYEYVLDCLDASEIIPLNLEVHLWPQHVQKQIKPLSTVSKPTANISPVFEEVPAQKKTSRIAGLKICVSQFTGSERLDVIELIKRYGGVHSPVLRRGAIDHLIVKSSEGEKYKKAKEWGIPVHTREWLEGMAREAQVL